MDFSLLAQGIIIGFSIALPIGPIGILCIRKTLAESHLSGIVIGLGAATADALYGCVAGFGLTFISDLLLREQMWIRLLGGVFLCYLGIKTFLARPAERPVEVNGLGLFSSYFSTLILTLTNPITIVAFLGIFAALGLGNGMSYGRAGTLVLGIFSGSVLWFFLLSSVVMLFREKISHVGLGWVNRIAGMLIILLGLVAILSFR